MGVFNVVVQNQKIDKATNMYDAGGEKLDLPESEDIIFMNTPFWGGGCQDTWGSKSIKPLEEIMEESFKFTNKKQPSKAIDGARGGSKDKKSKSRLSLTADNMWLR